MHWHTRGYTLYELLVTTGLIAILLGTAIPSFASIAARQRQLAEINALFHAIHVARKESIMRRKVVSLCPSHDGLSCTNSTDWSSGWLMFEDSDRDSPPHVAISSSRPTGAASRCEPLFFALRTGHSSSATAGTVFAQRAW